MRLLFFTIFLFGVYSYSFGQTLKGKVYDSKSIVKDIKVLNKTQNRLTVTDENGDFSIIAKINDTISFESVFYHPKMIVVTQLHFDDINVFEIKKITNELDEVEVKSEPEQPVFEEEAYNEDLQNLIKEDIKRNPHLYQPEVATYGVNFLYLIDLALKLFKSKKYKAPVYQPATYRQVDSLFSHSSFFNKRLVTEDLEIPENQVKLFYDFCSAKGISTELLKDDKKMELLEQLVLNSQLFLILLEEYGEGKVTKD